MSKPVPLPELAVRLQRLRARLDADQPHWELAALFGRVNQYYLTGTVQDGILLIPREAPAVFWVRRSFERARAESLFPDIRPMRSFRDAAAGLPGGRKVIHVETDLTPFGLVLRFRKYFPCEEIAPLDLVLSSVRAVKSSFELEIMARAGAGHRAVMEEGVPVLLREGMTEAEFACDLYSLFVRHGHQGVARFAMFGVELAVGQLGFGTNSLQPTNFDGPGGGVGLEPAAPVLGSRDRRLRLGDLVFVDTPFGCEGYHTDKTMTYVFGGELPAEAVASHRRCREIEARLAERLRPGAIPAAIYHETMGNLDPEFHQHFMGFGARRAAFLGHGVGLQVDETPVIADGFETPLGEGMVFALEPKKGVPGIGMVGSENTYLVTPEGGRSLTGCHPGLLRV